MFVDENGQKFSRAFHFTPRSGISHESTAPLNGDKPRETVVHLIGFNPRYREYSRKTASAIADSIFEHCLWYFIREGSAPLIYLLDDDERISLNDVFDGHMHTSVERDTIDLKGHKFDLVHVKLRSNSLLTHTIALCADNRIVSEPDICALNVFDEPLLVSEESAPPLASLEVVEIKRPVRKDAAPGEEHDPIEQAVGYLRRIREGKVSTASGRPIPASESIPGFCYILADLTPQFEQRCKDHHDLKRTADGLGYFGYKGNVNAYIEVISFNRLVNAAKERNRAFFDKLGLALLR